MFTKRTAIDIDGSERVVEVRTYNCDSKYYARVVYPSPAQPLASFSNDIDEAVYEAMAVWNHNHPKSFDTETMEKQAKVMEAVIKLFKPVVTRGHRRRYSSYYLKHIMEREIGEYVGNGEAKGALVKAGFSLAKGEDILFLNCEFLLKLIKV